MRHLFYLSAALALVTVWVVSLYWQPFLWAYVAVVPLVLLGVHDAFQTKRAVLRNFPVIGHGRYLLEAIRPEINQYFIESNTDGTPFNREVRSLVYQRAKGQLDTLPFGTQWDVYAQGYEWINHSLLAHHGPSTEPRVLVGEGTCAQPYSAALLNVSAMSYGALSKNAVMALNKGAKLGGFAHNTGEGGISPYHLEHGADLIWQIGTGYFGCRDASGNFDAQRFAENAARPSVKMIEVKLSQGAKPGHGGILPAAKVTAEIAEIRHVPLGKDVLSPPAHTAFTTPVELLEFVTELRRLSGGKPVGFKLCIGSRSEFLGICRAMQETRLHPDFITVDGGEGGTGAAPLEFSNSIGTPLVEGLVFVHNALTGYRLRDKIKVIASGKIVSGFHMARAMALGADLCNSARGMMLAIGCIQARRCNSNECPVGVATQRPSLVAGLDVEDKAERTRRFQAETVGSLLEILGAAGLDSPRQLEPRHIMRRVDPVTVKSYAELYDYVEPGALLFEPVPQSFEADWLRARSDRFA
ncbi:MAG: FMN-binding glutamate synthase family protein [Planctomycetes bacterium]|nr:FMN-binding glutamate synthase family protein [Planctomycetota bacterium]